MLFAYKRVSTVDQNTDRQLHSMGFDREFTEKVSGKDTNRPELKNMLDVLRENDEVQITIPDTHKYCF